MTDDEFDVLDELYFIRDFNSLSDSLDISEENTRDILESLITKNWVRVFYPQDREIAYDSSKYHSDYKKYYYIASKEGLLAHNGK